MPETFDHPRAIQESFDRAESRLISLLAMLLALKSAAEKMDGLELRRVGDRAQVTLDRFEQELTIFRFEIARGRRYAKRNV